MNNINKYRKDERRREEWRREEKGRKEKKQEEQRRSEKKNAHKFGCVKGISIILFLFLVSCSDIPNIYSRISENDIDAVKELVDDGLNVNTKGNYGTPFYYAISKGKWEIAKYLLKNGAEVNITNPKTGITPLMIVSAWGNLEMIKLLIDNNANVNAVDSQGYSVLMHACSPRASIEGISEIVHGGADIYYKKLVRDKGGEYELDLIIISAMENRQDLIKYFKRIGLDTKTGYPVVCVGFGTINLPLNNNDWRFNGSSSYSGKWKHKLNIMEINDEPWMDNNNGIIGEVSVNRHIFKVKQLSVPSIDDNKKKDHVSKLLVKSINCEANTIYVLYPVISQGKVQLKVLGFKV